MKLELAFEHACNGHAILFVGAGSSIDAINLKGEKIKTGGQLATFFANQAGIDSNTDLSIAAEEFKIKFGEEKMILEIQKEFTVRRVHDAHIQIAQIPWKRIYTTNYDNVMETAFAKVGKKLQSVTSDQEIGKVSKKTTLCVHLNGYVDQITAGVTDSSFKLTDGSYASSSIASSAWAGQFRDDIRIAKAVFFVGYSLADLDIQRLLFESSIIKDKCIFVVGNNPSQSTIVRARKFGEMFNLSTIEFAAMVNQFSAAYIHPEKLDFFGECVTKFEVDKKIDEILDRDVYNLVLYGKHRQSLILKSMTSRDLYYRERRQIEDVFSLVDSGERIVIIHSELGNGKTLFIEGLKITASQKGYDVYTATNRTRDLLNEIDVVTQSANKVMFVFENYFEWYDAIKYFINNSSSQSIAILSARTPAFEVTADELHEYLKTNYLPQINLDRLDKDDLEWVVNIFNQHGLWAERASYTFRQKTDILNRHPDFSSILLGLLKSPIIIKKFDEILAQLNNQRDYYQVIISILTLSVLNYQTTIDRLIDIWGDLVLNPKFKNDRIVSQLIEFDRGEILLRSSTLARYLLRHVVDGKIVVDTLIHLRRISEEKINTSDYFRTLAKNLVRFHNIQNLLPEANKKQAVLYYYESIKNLPSSRENPLFWLQYGIACLVLKEFERTERYLSSAYAYAKQTPNFDVFQIDNHFARYLLEKAIDEGNDQNFMGTFRKVRNIIDGQMRRETLHYPYKVAQLYADFFLTYESRLSHTEKREIADVASAIISRINRLSKSKREQEYILQCASNMQLILEKVAGI